MTWVIILCDRWCEINQSCVEKNTAWTMTGFTEHYTVPQFPPDTFQSIDLLQEGQNLSTFQQPEVLCIEDFNTFDRKFSFGWWNSKSRVWMTLETHGTHICTDVNNKHTHLHNTANIYNACILQLTSKDVFDTIWSSIDITVKDYLRICLG